MGDVKHYLRKLDFPDVVPKALNHIQKLWLPDCTSQQLGLMKEMSEEFVFFEIDKWGNVRKQNLQPIKELQILERICNHFKEHENEQKLATFLFLFPFGSSLLEKRIGFLKKLVSLAIAIGNSNVLTYVGTWMQLCGCASENSVSIAKSVNQEYFRTKPADNEIIKSLPNQSPLFCNSLVAALANVFELNNLPDNVMRVILDWITRVPSICFESLNMIIPNAFNFSGPQTPLPYLIRWTVLSPLCCKKFLESRDQKVNVDIFAELHLAVLQALLQGPKVCNLSKWEAVSSDSLKNTVETLSKVAHSPDSMKLSLDRLAQCLEIGLSTNCIHSGSGKLRELFVCCCNLPYNKLLNIFLQKWSRQFESKRILK